MDSMRQESNQTRLDTAFYVAEVKLGVTRLLDPEDVDVPNPDEKSVMTYVAQFLHRYPEGSVNKVRHLRIQHEKRDPRRKRTGRNYPDVRIVYFSLSHSYHVLATRCSEN